MSVTVADLLKLPSLRQAKVIGGAKGLGKTVSSISVLESVDPGVLVQDVYKRQVPMSATRAPGGTICAQSRSRLDIGIFIGSPFTQKSGQKAAFC